MSENKQIETVDISTVLNERKRWLFFGLPFTFTKYSLTPKSLKLTKGLFSTTEDDILLFRVMDVSVKRTLMQKMAGLGSMTVSSSDKSNPVLEVRNIRHIHEFKNALDERVEKERLRMRFRAGEIMGEYDQDFDGSDGHIN